MANLTDKTAFEGETLAATFAAPGAEAVTVTLSDGATTKAVNCTENGGAWTFSASSTDLAGLSGEVKWCAMATSSAGVTSIAHGGIYIRPLVSRYRAVLRAIDSAIESWSTNPNHTVTVGELTIQAKTIDDLFKARSYYAGKVQADETGTTVAAGPRIAKICFRGI